MVVASFLGSSLVTDKGIASVEANRVNDPGEPRCGELAARRSLTTDWVGPSTARPGTWLSLTATGPGRDRLSSA